MSRPKARYNRPVTTAERLKLPAPAAGHDYERLREWMPSGTLPDTEDRLIAIAIDTTEALRQGRLGLSKEDARAEADNLLRSVEATMDKLRHISPDLDRMLGVDADPLGAADALDELTKRIAAARQAIETTRWPHPREVEHNIALNMAIYVFQVADAASMKLTIGRDIHPGNAPPLLQAIGSFAGLDREEDTWRQIAVEAREAMNKTSPQ